MIWQRMKKKWRWLLILYLFSVGIFGKEHSDLMVYNNIKRLSGPICGDFWTIQNVIKAKLYFLHNAIKDNSKQLIYSLKDYKNYFNLLSVTVADV